MITRKLKSMHYRIITILFVLLLPSGLSGQSFSEMRSFQKTLKISEETTLEINNKYGTIHITPWNRDSVSIRAEVEAYASNLDRLRKIFQGIEVKIEDINYLVKAETRFTQSINMLFESFKGMTSKIIPYESGIKINYFINAPEYLNMKIINKYGDVYLENNTGKFSLNLSNGSFRANILSQAGEIQLSFCDATINKLEKGHLNASFSEVEITESRDISITSISSRFEIKNAGMLDSESRRDKFFIGSVGSIRGNSYFTDYRIEELTKEINLVTKYGSLNTDIIKKTIGMVTINSAYTDISLTFEPELSYNLDIRHLNTFVVVPFENSKIEKKILNEDKKEYITYGTVGKNPGNIKVIINSTRGNIYLR